MKRFELVLCIITSFITGFIVAYFVFDWDNIMFGSDIKKNPSYQFLAYFDVYPRDFCVNNTFLCYQEFGNKMILWVNSSMEDACGCDDCNWCGGFFDVNVNKITTYSYENKVRK